MNRNLVRAGTLACILLWACASTGHARAAEPLLTVSVNGRAAETVTPGTRIAVTMHRLPPARRAYCLGLASAIDRYSLPLSLGRVARDTRGNALTNATIPPRLLPAEPAGPYMLFVGACTAIAPDRPFVAHTMIHIVPART